MQWSSYNVLKQGEHRDSVNANKHLAWNSLLSYIYRRVLILLRYTVSVKWPFVHQGKWLISQVSEPSLRYIPHVDDLGSTKLAHGGSVCKTVFPLVRHSEVSLFYPPLSAIKLDLIINGAKMLLDWSKKVHHKQLSLVHCRHSSRLFKIERSAANGAIKCPLDDEKENVFDCIG